MIIMMAIMIIIIIIIIITNVNRTARWTALCRKIVSCCCCTTGWYDLCCFAPRRRRVACWETTRRVARRTFSNNAPRAWRQKSVDRVNVRDSASQPASWELENRRVSGQYNAPVLLLARLPLVPKHAINGRSSGAAFFPCMICIVLVPPPHSFILHFLPCLLLKFAFCLWPRLFNYRFSAIDSTFKCSLFRFAVAAV